MAQTILIKRGLAANLTFTPLEGELVWTTDTKRIVMGDGTTVGGIDLFSSVESSIAGNTLDISTNATDIATNASGLVTVNSRIDNLTTDDIVEGTNLYYTDTRADARVQSAISDTATSTTTLWSSDKINSVMLSGISYQGHWDASTNTPTLANGTPGASPELHGDFYITDVAGTVDFGAGAISFEIGDNVIYDDGLGTWEKSVNSNKVQSVNGFLGTVVLGGADILATGYTIATTASAIAATDDLNTALGKLEKGIQDAQSGGELNVQSDWNETNNTLDSFILNKPTDVTDLTLHTLSELSNVVETSITTDDYLSWDGTNWINKSPATVAFDDLSDVDTTTTAPAATDLIQFDGTNWIPTAASTVGRTTFTALDDTPTDYTGSGGFTVQVNASATALEFVDNSVINGGTF